MNIGGDDFVFQSQYGFNDARDPRSALRVADVGLDLLESVPVSGGRSVDLLLRSILHL